jgi:hypothetical protein
MIAKGMSAVYKSVLNERKRSSEDSWGKQILVKSVTWVQANQRQLCEAGRTAHSE